MAKKYFSPYKAKFFNALLRKIETSEVALPTGDQVADMSVRLSYPPFFVSQLIAELGQEQALKILELGNRSSPLMARRRKAPFQMVEVDNLEAFASSKDFYIQNPTPAHLFEALSTQPFSPKRILDLCAAPGGKLLLAHDVFPEAELCANDLSPAKIQTLRENMAKYGLSATLSCGPGEEYASRELFDLIILDVPCSNTGVLNKRPEARWRLSPSNLQQLTDKACKLLAKAATLINNEGRIWYMTCSILQEENQRFIAQAEKLLPLRKTYEKLILPSEEGLDGGYAAELRLK